MPIKKLVALLIGIGMSCLIVPAMGSLTPAPSIITGYAGSFNPGVTATIAASAATTGAITLKGFVPVGIYLPGTFTGTSLTFTACDTSGGTYLVVKSTTSGTSLSYTVAQNTYVALDPKDFAGINYLKIVSGSTEGSARTLKIALKGL